jgi:hypothetical protein
MTRYALDIHPDDRAMWMRMTGRDETRPYDMPRLGSVDYMVASAARNGIRLEWREIPEEQP